MHMEKSRKDALPPVDEAALKRADAALRRLLASPPAPFTPKAKKRSKKK
jgi:hypothetical protein